MVAGNEGLFHQDQQKEDFDDSGGGLRNKLLCYF